MKKVFSNAEQTIHVWAQQSQPEGRSKNCYFEGATVYSYGSHYPLGLFVTNKAGATAVLINESGYSSTTAKHIGAARYAVNHHTRFGIYDNDTMKELVSAVRYSSDKYKAIRNSLSGAIQGRIKNYYDGLRIDTKKRRVATLEKTKNGLLARCQHYITVLEWFGLKPTKGALQAMQIVAGAAPDQIKEIAIKAKQIEDRKRAVAEKKHLAARAKQRAEAVQLFLAGENLYNGNLRNDLYEHDTILLRVKGDVIQTSRGAEFPIKHALKALPIIRNMKAEGKEWHTNGHTIHLGNFHIDTIRPDGTVIAGCHTVPYAEIERVAAQLGA